MLQDNEEKLKEQKGMLDLDNDGHESVAEYYAKKKTERKDEEEQKKADKKPKQNDDEQALQAVGHVISAVPHFASFALGAGAGGGLGWLIDKLRADNGEK